MHISSLAVVGPAQGACPLTEDAPPRPISEYGRSKLAAERAVLESCRVPFTVLRPPGVYGPRDYAFLPLFRAVKRHLLPRNNRNQQLSLVFGPDLAEAAVRCLQHPGGAGKVYFVAGREVVTATDLGRQIAREMKRWTIPLPVPAALLWTVCLGQEACSRLTGKPTLLNLQKYSELRAPGWVCDPSRLEREIGFTCATTIAQGVCRTVAWYRQNHWL